MFTGLIQAVGHVQYIEPLDHGKRYTISRPNMPNDIELGESIAIDGCCMTVTKIESQAFQVEASSETLGLTLMESYKEGHNVNLERALSLNAKLGGHSVTGHIDGKGTLLSKEADGVSWKLWFKVAPQAKEITLPCLIHKGAIAINGISLTVNEVIEDEFTVTIIPFTYEHTNLSSLESGQTVNLEGDMLGKYVNRHLSAVLSSTGLTPEMLTLASVSHQH